MLPPLLLQRLRAWWKSAHAEGRIRADGWLFPGADPMLPLSTRQLNRVVHGAAEAAGIEKRIAMHTLRHSFATHLLEQKVDIRMIQVLLGHKKLETTSMYAQVATELLREVISQIETLPSQLAPPLWSGLSWRSPTSSEGTGQPGVSSSGHLSLGQLRVMTAIERCRMAALGGRAALRGLRHRPGVVQLVSQPPLPQVPVQRRAALVARARG